MDQEAEPLEEVIRAVDQYQAMQVAGERQGELTIYTCPECGGNLWQAGGEVMQFRCHVGHLYNATALLEAQADSVENALWRASRTLVDQSILAKQLAKIAVQRNAPDEAAMYTDRASSAVARAEAIRHFIEEGATQT